MRLAERAQSLTASQTSVTRTLATEMAACGTMVANLAAGELDCDTSEVVKRGALAAIAERRNRYTDVAGIKPLRRLIAQRMEAVSNQPWTADEIVLTAGAKQALFNCAMLLFGPGDEVLIPTPCWGTFPAQVELAGALPVLIDTRPNQYHLSADAITSKLTARTRGIIINSPNNPTGAVYGEASLAQIVRIAAERKIFVIFDECYSDFVFEPHRHRNPLALVPEAREWVITINSFSKTHALTGWRLGYLAAPTDIATAVAAFQSHSTSNPSTIAQYGVLADLEERDDTFLRTVHSALRRRRTCGLAILREARDVAVMEPEGAFYFYVDVGRKLGTQWRGQPIRTIGEMCRLLLSEAHAAVVAGSAFRDPNGFRASFAIADEELIGGLQRIVAVLNELK